MKTVAIIPARGGSKGIFRKNLVDLGGVPLIAWSICVAQAAKKVHSVVVSTDDEEIAEAARRLGALTPFSRPPQLAGDNIGMGPVMAHAVRALKEGGFDFQAYAVLYPTQPFRTPSMLDEAISGLEDEYFGFAYLRRHTVNPHHWFGKRDGFLEAIGREETPEKLTVFSDCGCLFIRAFMPDGYESADKHNKDRIILNALQQGDKRFLTETKHDVIDDPITLMDIDSYEDLETARSAIRLGKVTWLPPGASKQQLSQSNAKLINSKKFYEPEIEGGTLEHLVSPIESGTVNSSKATPIDIPQILDPAALRSLVNRSSPHSGRDVVIHRADIAIDKSVFNYSSPALQLNTNTWFPVRAARLLQRKLFAYFPIREGSEKILAGLMESLDCSYRDSLVELHLPEPAARGDRIQLSIYGGDSRPLYDSGFYGFDNGTWSRSGGLPFLADLSAVDLRGNETALTFTKQAAMSFGRLIWSREAPGDTTWGHEPEALTFPGWTDYDPESYTWIDTVTGKMITGRQHLPKIHHWAGLAYLPVNVSNGSKWISMSAA